MPKKNFQLKESVINEFKVGPELMSKLVKKDGKWYIDDEKIEDWKSTWDRLDEKDVDDHKYGRWK